MSYFLVIRFIAKFVLVLAIYCNLQFFIKLKELEFFLNIPFFQVNFAYRQN